MNRIYQGRVSGVSTLNPDKEAALELRWLPQNGWENELWRHHALFQCATNYYTLCLAAMARGIDEPEFLAIALKVAEDSARRDPKHKTDAARQKAVEVAAETAKAGLSASGA